MIICNMRSKRSDNYDTKIIKVEGMSCEHCRNAVESALAKLNGVSSAEVNLDENHVRVEYNDSKVTFENMKKQLKNKVMMLNNC